MLRKIIKSVWFVCCYLTALTAAAMVLVDSDKTVTELIMFMLWCAILSGFVVYVMALVWDNRGGRRG